MTNTFIFLAYLLLFMGIFKIGPFFKKSGIPLKWLIGIFLFKICMGAIFLNSATSPTGDYTRFYKDAHYLIHTLAEQPKLLWSYILLPQNAWDYNQILPYLQKCLINGVPAHNHFTLKLYLVEYLLTDGNRYAGVVIMAFLQVVATVFVFKTIVENYPKLPKFLLLTLLLFPFSFNFFTNIFHKEGFIFLGLSICI